MSKHYWRTTLPMLLATLVAAPFAAAQDEDLEELQALTFTGTRLTGAEVEGSLPLVTYTQEDIELSPATSPVEFLRDLPIIGGPDTQNSNFTNGTDGAARVGLRGITGGNTLILLNGRRLTPSGTGATPDLNQIPLAAVKEIQILKAGGSVTYGTSAVAGVINFILDDEFEGLDFKVGYGFAEDGGVAAETTASFIVGGRGAGGKFKFTFGGSFRDENDMNAPDRPYMLGGGTSTYGNPGRWWFTESMEDAIFAATGLSESAYTGTWTLKPGIDVAKTPADFAPWINVPHYQQDSQGRSGTRFPYENFTIAVNPNRQYSVFSTADYEINDKWSFFAEMGYSYSELEFRLAPSPDVTPPYAATFVPGSNYWLRQIFGDDVMDDAVEEYDWNGYAVDGYYRFVELGPRINEIQRRSLRTVLGVKGELPGNWNLETYLLYSDEKLDDRELNGGSIPQLTELLALNTPDAYNVFTRSWIQGENAGEGMINPADPNGDAADEIRADNETDTFSKTELFDFRLSNTELFELPAGPVEVVVGYEFRRQYAKSKPDFLKLGGSLGWNAASGTTEGGREVMGGYAEAGIPILENLDVSVSARYEDYQAEFKTDVIGGKVRYQPVRDLTLRASFSQAFVAPDLIDLYNPGQQGFPELNDPYYPASDPLRLYQVGVNYVGSQYTGVPLKPETADVYSVGATYSPGGIKGLDITVDWWRLEKVDLIVYSVQSLISEFRNSYPNGNNGSKTPPPANSPYLSENGGPIIYDWASDEPIAGIEGAGPRNVAGEKIEGIDIIVSYLWETDKWGTFDFVLDSSYTLDWQQQSSISNEWNKFIGEYDGDVAYPRFRTSLSTTWNYGDWTVSGVMHYTGRTRDLNVDSDEEGVKTHVEEHIEWDFVAQYVLPWFKSDLQSTTLTVGVENAFNQDPPFMNTAFSNNYPERNYDPRGRFWFVRVDQSF